ncbi:MAG: hypothetical protein E7323_07460 [Clostridiales bacterium]|nr:hypothetical protein [Clostridiales bacterium]
MLIRTIKLAVLTLLTYLLQATTAQYISVWDVAPNIALAFIAVVTVGFGPMYTLMMSLAVGYLMEIMLAGMQFFNLVLYPVASMLGALAFADKSERSLEERRAQGRDTRQLHPHLRTPLCAMIAILVFEFIHVIYIYLSGVDLDAGHIQRALVDVVYTMLLAAVFQFPIRAYLGIYRQNRENRERQQAEKRTL